MEISKGKKKKRKKNEKNEQSKRERERSFGWSSVCLLVEMVREESGRRATTSGGDAVAGEVKQAQGQGQILTPPPPLPAPTGEDQAKAAFALGAEPGRLNLRTVLTRCLEMHDSLSRLEVELQFDTGDLNQKRWKQLADLFSMTHLQYNALLEQLRNNLQFWAIYPKRVEQDLAMKLQAGMISPKLLVEIEKENENILEESEVTLQDIRDTVAHVNQVVEHITKYNQGVEGSGALDPRSPSVTKLLAQMRKDRKARAATQHSKQASSTPKLKQMIEFMKTGAL